MNQLFHQTTDLYLGDFHAEICKQGFPTALISELAICAPLQPSPHRGRPSDSFTMPTPNQLRARIPGVGLGLSGLH